MGLVRGLNVCQLVQVLTKSKLTNWLMSKLHGLAANLFKTYA